LLNESWNFGSGIGHSRYIAAGFLPMDDGEMRWVSESFPEMRVAVIPRDQISFNDGWYVQGLKGTGSYDYRAQDVFVPANRTFELFVRQPYRGTSPATRMGLMPVTAAGQAPVSQMFQEPLGERLGVFPVHEMSAADLLDDVLVLEHPGGAAIVRRLGDWIVEAREGDRRHRDPRPQRCAGYGGEFSVITERRVQALGV
jgi:hypothetical protein